MMDFDTYYFYAKEAISGIIIFAIGAFWYSQGMFRLMSMHEWKFTYIKGKEGKSVATIFMVIGLVLIVDGLYNIWPYLV